MNVPFSDEGHIELRIAAPTTDIGDVNLNDHEAVLSFVMQGAVDGDLFVLTTRDDERTRRVTQALGLGDGLLLVEDSKTGDTNHGDSN